jgi:Helix-turn-helix domain
MPRERRTSPFPIAVSAARAADSLGIRPEQIQEAITRGELPCYSKGVRRRVLVADLTEWVRKLTRFGT